MLYFCEIQRFDVQLLRFLSFFIYFSTSFYPMEWASWEMAGSEAVAGSDDVMTRTQEMMYWISLRTWYMV
jgi:hypothetical protein